MGALATPLLLVTCLHRTAFIGLKGRVSKGSGESRDRRDHPSSGLLPRWPQWAGLARSKPGAVNLRVLCCFPSCIHKELDPKWSSGNSSQCTCGKLHFRLQCSPLTRYSTAPATTHFCHQWLSGHRQVDPSDRTVYSRKL